MELDTLQFLEDNRKLNHLKKSRFAYTVIGITIALIGMAILFMAVTSFIPALRAFLSVSKTYVSLMNATTLNTTQIKALVAGGSAQGIFWSVCSMSLSLSIVGVLLLLVGALTCDQAILQFTKYKEFKEQYEKKYGKLFDELEKEGRKK